MSSYLVNYYVAAPLLSLPIFGTIFYALGFSDENEWVQEANFVQFCDEGYKWENDQNQCQKVITHQETIYKI